MMRRSFAMLVVLVAAIKPASAFELSGPKQIAVETRDGRTITIGTVDFTPDTRTTTFVVHIDTWKLKDFFLSMREFKCLEGAEIECYVPYPYKNPSTVTPTDLAWLAHALLFFFKNPADYGAKLSNGLIYDLKLTEHGIEGAPQAIDLDAIASPPDNPLVPPFDKDSRSDIADGTRWISRLTIKDMPAK